MGNVREEDQGFLSGGMLLAATFKLETALVGFDFGFAGAAVIILCDHFRWRPLQNRADDDGILHHLMFGEPAQGQGLCRTHVCDRLGHFGHPSLLAQVLPSLGSNAFGKDLRAAPAFVLGQHLP